jgi:hypothetical protein
VAAGTRRGVVSVLSGFTTESTEGEFRIDISDLRFETLDLRFVACDIEILLLLLRVLCGLRGE